MHIVLLAHSHVKPFTPPGSGEGYDRYELKMEKRSAAKVKEWADYLFFIGRDDKVTIKKDGDAKALNKGGKKRVVDGGNARV